MMLIIKKASITKEKNEIVSLTPSHYSGVTVYLFRLSRAYIFKTHTPMESYFTGAYYLSFFH